MGDNKFLQIKNVIKSMIPFLTLIKSLVMITHKWRDYRCMELFLIPVVASLSSKFSLSLRSKNRTEILITQKINN